MIRDSNQDGVDLVSGEHLVEVAISEAGLVQRRHAFAEVIGEITNGGQLDIAGLLRASKCATCEIGPQPRMPRRN